MEPDTAPDTAPETQARQHLLWNSHSYRVILMLTEEPSHQTRRRVQQLAARSLDQSAVTDTKGYRLFDNRGMHMCLDCMILINQLNSRLQTCGDWPNIRSVGSLIHMDITVIRQLQDRMICKVIFLSKKY